MPAIKLEFMGIEMDLLYAQLTQTSVSEDVELMNVELLRNLDDRFVNRCARRTLVHTHDIPNSVYCKPFHSSWTCTHTNEHVGETLHDTDTRMHARTRAHWTRLQKLVCTVRKVKFSAVVRLCSLMANGGAVSSVIGQF